MFTYCYASGEIEIGNSLPDGALPLFKGRKADAERVQQRGRLAYNGETWLVPGIPEAKNPKEAIDAFIRFRNWATTNLNESAA